MAVDKRMLPFQFISAKENTIPDIATFCILIIARKRIGNTVMHHVVCRAVRTGGQVIHQLLLFFFIEHSSRECFLSQLSVHLFEFGQEQFLEFAADIAPIQLFAVAL